jgi:hypothetical protein
LEKLTEESFAIISKSRKPIIIAFLDFYDEKYKAESEKLKGLMIDLSLKYRTEASLAYVLDHSVSRDILGIEWVELPGLAIQTMDNRIYAYPDGM